MPRPNVLIYLGALLQPARLRPDLRVPSISYVDWEKARRDGYNAVVIDKDNCLTWPHRDELHPSITKAWYNLKHAFGPGNVLIVSNSAGTTKDVGGIAAESVSRALGAPVLLHAQGKPGCTDDIVRFFAGRMPIRGVSARVNWEETEGWEVVKGGVVDTLQIETERDGGTLLGRRGTTVTESGVSASPPPPPPTHTAAAATTNAEPAIKYRTPLDHPKILVIGDRLSTDVLLARRLATYYPPTEEQRVVSIVTTALFKRADARALRWAEEAWLRVGMALAARFARRRADPRERVRESMRGWVLAESVDAPTPITPTPTEIQAVPSGIRARIKGYFSATEWKAWFWGKIPSRARVWLAFKSGLRRAGVGMVRGVRRVLVRTSR